MRPLLYIKSEDILLTTDLVNQWVYKDGSQQMFCVKTCILFLLIVGSGTTKSPELDKRYLVGKGLKSIGWKTAYKDMPHYPLTLQQTMPSVDDQVSRVHDKVEGYTVSEEEYQEEELFAKRMKLEENSPA